MLHLEDAKSSKNLERMPFHARGYAPVLAYDETFPSTTTTVQMEFRDRNSCEIHNSLRPSKNQVWAGFSQ